MTSRAIHAFYRQLGRLWGLLPPVVRQVAVGAAVGTLVAGLAARGMGW